MRRRSSLLLPPCCWTGTGKGTGTPTGKAGGGAQPLWLIPPEKHPPALTPAQSKAGQSSHAFIVSTMSSDLNLEHL